MIVGGRNRQHDERLSQCRLTDLFKLDAVGRGGGDLLKIIEDLLPVCQLAIFANMKSQEESGEGTCAAAGGAAKQTCRNRARAPQAIGRRNAR